MGFESIYFLQVGSLMIESARKAHSGNYTCHPSNSSPSTVTLHVISSKLKEMFLTL